MKLYKTYKTYKRNYIIRHLGCPARARCALATSSKLTWFFIRHLYK